MADTGTSNHKHRLVPIKELEIQAEASQDTSNKTRLIEIFQDVI